MQVSQLLRELFQEESEKRGIQMAGGKKSNVEVVSGDVQLQPDPWGAVE